MDHSQTFHVAIFQVLQFLAKHDRVNRLVGIDKGEGAVRLARQHCAKDRQNWCDARSACKAKIGFGTIRTDVRIKVAHGRHRIQPVANLELVVCEV